MRAMTSSKRRLSKMSSLRCFSSSATQAVCAMAGAGAVEDAGADEEPTAW